MCPWKWKVNSAEQKITAKLFLCESYYHFQFDVLRFTSETEIFFQFQEFHKIYNAIFARCNWLFILAHTHTHAHTFSKKT